MALLLRKKLLALLLREKLLVLLLSANGAATIGYCGATFIGLFGAIVGLNVL